MYNVIKKLGIGTKATVYQIQRQGLHYAVKIQNNDDHSSLLHQAKIIKFLSSQKKEEGIPDVYRCSYQGNKVMMVMQLLGPSLQDLFLLKDKKFSISICVSIFEQAVRRLEYLHKKGYVHRDIKPQNFLIGKTDMLNIYLVDYGLANKYIQNDGSHILDREKLPFIGNPRFASIRAHQFKEQSRKDDLESLIYMMIYLTKGTLPWIGLKCSSLQQKLDKIRDKKETNTPEQLCKNLPNQFLMILHHVKNLGFDQSPNYVMIKNLIKNIASLSLEEVSFSQWIKEIEI